MSCGVSFGGKLFGEREEFEEGNVFVGSTSSFVIFEVFFIDSTGIN